MQSVKETQEVRVEKITGISLGHIAGVTVLPVAFQRLRQNK
jgi:hypothetical protein